MNKQYYCEICGEITKDINKINHKGNKINVCVNCFESKQKEKLERDELINYICNKQNIYRVHPHTAKQIKELIEEGYTYKQLLFYSRFYYEFENNTCLPKYNHTIAWLKSRAIPNADAYMEMNDLIMGDIFLEDNNDI